MDLNKAIRMAVDTGKIEFGLKSSLDHARHATAKVIVISNNCTKKDEIEKFSKISGIKVIEFSGRSIDLGAICGKPYPISVLSVIDLGNSELGKV